MWTIRPTMHATRGDPPLSSLVLRQALKKVGQKNARLYKITWPNEQPGITLKERGKPL